MKNAGKAELLAENVNAWLGEKERRLIRILDGKVRVIRACANKKAKEACLYLFGFFFNFL